MGEPSPERIIRSYIDAIVAKSEDQLERLRHPDWYLEWPQTGERIRGHANDAAIRSNWPGGFPTPSQIRVVGSEDRWVVSPSYTIHRVAGSGEAWWTDGTIDYPDGSRWFFAQMLQLRDARIYRETWYFAPTLEAPAWRSQWVERM